MSEREDVVVLGAGAEGLVAACTLAAKGRLVRVLDPAPEIGGIHRSAEIAPGYSAPMALADVGSFHPSIIRGHRLEKHGLRLRPLRGGVFLASPNDGNLFLTPGGWREELELAAPAERAPLTALLDLLGSASRALEPLWSRPLPPPRPQNVGDALELARLGWRLRTLGARRLPEVLRLLPMPVRDLLDERLGDERLRTVLAGSALSFGWLAPRSAGSAHALLLRCPAWGNGPFAPPVAPEGGPAGLLQALASAAEELGVEIDCDAGIASIHLDRGRAAGVVLEDGRLVEASAVLSTFDPRRTLLHWVGPRALAPETVQSLQRIRGRGAAALVRFAIDRLPAFHGAPTGSEHLFGRIQVGDHQDHLERAFDAAKYGTVPKSPWLELIIPSLAQSGLAPEGHHVVVARAQTCPYQLTSGSWDLERAPLADRVTAQIESVAPGFSSSILHRDVLAPPDLEARLALPGGCLSQVDQSLDQLLHLRPLAGWYDHRTPIEGLYLGGTATHPGIPGSGLCGRNAARNLLHDWRRGRIALAFR